MITRKTSVKKYFLAFVLTILVFGGGILLGLALEKVRLNDSKEITLTEKVNLRSLQLQQNYIKSGIADCKALNQLLETNIDELGQKMAIIIDYQKNALLNQNEFDLQLRDYFLTEIQFLLISQEISQQCEKNNVRVIYFYDENGQDTQGRVLDYLKDVFENRVLIFSFNSQFSEEPMIPILITSYNITQFPAVVVENHVFQGYTSVETLMDTICTEFENLGEKNITKCQQSAGNRLTSS